MGVSRIGFRRCVCVCVAIVLTAACSAGPDNARKESDGEADTDEPSDPQGEPPPPSESTPDLAKIRDDEARAAAIAKMLADQRAAELAAKARKDADDRAESDRQARIANGPPSGWVCDGKPRGTWYRVEFFTNRNGRWAHVYYLTTPNETDMGTLSVATRDGNRWTFIQSQDDFAGANGGRWQRLAVTFDDGLRASVWQAGGSLGQGIPCGSGR
jgi:hypothetical protein